MKNRTYILPTRTEYRPYEKTIHEYRAPTDDSIRLYKEILSKAYDSIIDSFTVDTNIFKAKCMVVRMPWELTDKCLYKLTLNGKELTGEVPIEVYKRGDYHDIIRKISEHIAHNILTNCVGPIITHVLRTTK